MLPTIPGLTETSRETAPLYRQLMDVLSRRSGASQGKIAEAIDRLEVAAGEEADEETRNRILAGIAVIRGCPDDGDEAEE